ncbi:hypothetical protein LTR62_006175 [Meristemomyces frigidus]|uniref:Plastocyanin-like domain-containing protein n=1 Tax=Meristemomyces frigidus TaxID=1508187 RepID=A0AAN7TC07_9PEZI|nr:hypothetical protein LTR62_006175 [Meristemomyces frigidus]
MAATLLSCLNLCSSALPCQSNLGSLNTPRLPPYINGPHPGGSLTPWGPRNASSCIPYDISAIPNTGVTRRYAWTVTNTTLSPDGVELSMLVVNGVFPGETIEANWGEWIEVAVTNGLEDWDTLHGRHTRGNAMSYCLSKTFTYRIRAELCETSWWHGHYSAQYVNGISGAIFIHGPSSDKSYDIDVEPVLLTDWFHDFYDNLIIDVFYATETGIPHFPPMANNMLINGKNNYPCANATGGHTCTPNAGLASFKFESGKKHRLRLINHAAEALVFFSIDGYEMTVIANDFVSVVPHQTDLVQTGVGQRTDVIVTGRNNSKESV